MCVPFSVVYIFLFLNITFSKFRPISLFLLVLFCPEEVGTKLIERLSFTFTPNGKREFVPRDQVFPLFFVYCLLLLHKNK